MNLEQFKINRQNKRELSTLNEAQQKLVLELEERRSVVKGLVMTPGWKAVKEYLMQSIGFYKDSLSRLNPSNPTDIIRVQEAINAREDIIRYIENQARQ